MEFLRSLPDCEPRSWRGLKFTLHILVDNDMGPYFANKINTISLALAPGYFSDYDAAIERGTPVVKIAPDITPARSTLLRNALESLGRHDRRYAGERLIMAALTTALIQ